MRKILSYKLDRYDTCKPHICNVLTKTAPFGAKYLIAFVEKVHLQFLVRLERSLHC